MAAEYAGEEKELRRLLKASAYDVGRITSIPRTIRETPSSQTLKEARENPAVSEEWRCVPRGSVGWSKARQRVQALRVLAVSMRE